MTATTELVRRTQRALDRLTMEVRGLRAVLAELVANLFRQRGFHVDGRP